MRLNQQQCKFSLNKTQSSEEGGAANRDRDARRGVLGGTGIVGRWQEERNSGRVGAASHDSNDQIGKIRERNT